MARNCSKCGDTTCNCAVIEGPGVNITGIGTGASPYVVEADLVIADTTSVDLSGNGGSAALSATVKVKPAGGISISATGLEVDECALTTGLNNVPSGQVLVKGADPDGCLGILEEGLPGQVLTQDAGGAAVWGDVLAPIADLDITGGTPVFVDTGNLDPPDFVLRSTPIGSIDITNPSTSHSVEIVYANQYSKYAEAYNPRGWDVGFTPYLDPGNGILAPELLSIGGGIKSIQFEGTSYIGSGGAGTTPAVSSDTTIGIPTNIVIAPGATVTIRYKMEVQGSAFMNGISPVRARAYVFPRIFSQRFV